MLQFLFSVATSIAILIKSFTFGFTEAALSTLFCILRIFEIIKINMTLRNNLNSEKKSVQISKMIFPILSVQEFNVLFDIGQIVLLDLARQPGDASRGDDQSVGQAVLLYLRWKKINILGQVSAQKNYTSSYI